MNLFYINMYAMEKKFRKCEIKLDKMYYEFIPL